MDLLYFFKKWETGISRKSHVVLHKLSVLCTICIWQSSSLQLQVHYFLSHSLIHVLSLYSRSGCDGRPALFFKEVLFYGKSTFDFVDHSLEWTPRY